MIRQVFPRTFTAVRVSSRRALLAALLTLVAFVVAPAGPASADDATVRVMTYNLYQGTDFEELLGATTPGEFVAAVTTTYNNILATDRDARAAAVARIIAREKPDIVGLQEATILRNGTLPPTNVVSDQLQSLLSELDERGEQYRIVGILPGIDAAVPSTLGFFVRHTYRLAIIARDESRGRSPELSNHQIEQFFANLAFPTAVGVPFNNTRGWASVDVEVRDTRFRFVTTHLEAASPAIQLAQAAELLATAGNTALPTIMAADFNTTANDTSDPTFPTYQLLIGAGFKDAWKTKFPTINGFTCCQEDDVNNDASALSDRIDLILYRGDVSVESVKVVGASPGDKTSSGLWPSDHAGVVANLRIGRPGHHDDDDD